MKIPIVLTEQTVNPDSLVRVASLNLLNNPSRIVERVEAFIRVAGGLEFNILCLQEVLESEQYRIIDRVSEALGFRASYSDMVYHEKVGHNQGNVILAKDPATTFATINLEVTGFPQNTLIPPAAVVSKSIVNGRELHVITAHLTWGSTTEWVRLRQVEKINEYAWKAKELNPKAIVIFTGDLNAVDESSTLRYLYGNQEGSRHNGTVWVDAWKMFGTEENRVTSNPESFWGKETAKNHSSSGSIFNSLTPKRRIDYILSYEWCYGKPGSPLSFHRFADTPMENGLEISDHYGIYSDIYVPE